MPREIKIADLGRPLRVGERVRVRDDLNSRRRYYSLYSDSSDIATSEMIDLSGEIVTIKSVHGKYRVKESTWNWTDEMFDCLIDDTFEDDTEWELSPISMLI